MSSTRASRVRRASRSWTRMSDEQLLGMRFCDLKLSYERTSLARRLSRLLACTTVGATARPRRKTPEYAHADRTYANYPGPECRRSGACGRCPRVLAPPTASLSMGRGSG